MQVFLPYPDIDKSLSTLDNRRLGKQRVEASQILSVLRINYNKKGWINHPAVKMFRGYENFLTVYYNSSLRHFASRGGNNIKLQPIAIDETKTVLPKWFGNPEFHKSHRANLLRKALENLTNNFNADLYKRLIKNGIEDDLDENTPYIWPIE